MTWLRFLILNLLFWRLISKLLLRLFCLWLGGFLLFLVLLEELIILIVVIVVIFFIVVIEVVIVLVLLVVAIVLLITVMVIILVVPLFLLLALMLRYLGLVLRIAIFKESFLLLILPSTLYIVRHELFPIIFMIIKGSFSRLNPTIFEYVIVPFKVIPAVFFVIGIDDIWTRFLYRESRSIFCVKVIFKLCTIVGWLDLFFHNFHLNFLLCFLQLFLLHSNWVAPTSSRDFLYFRSWFTCLIVCRLFLFLHYPKRYVFNFKF